MITVTKTWSLCTQVMYSATVLAAQWLWLLALRDPTVRLYATPPKVTQHFYWATSAFPLTQHSLQALWWLTSGSLMTHFRPYVDSPRALWSHLRLMLTPLGLLMTHLRLLDDPPQAYDDSPQALWWLTSGPVLTSCVMYCCPCVMGQHVAAVPEVGWLQAGGWHHCRPCQVHVALCIGRQGIVWTLLACFNCHWVVCCPHQCQVDLIILITVQLQRAPVHQPPAHGTLHAHSVKQSRHYAFCNNLSTMKTSKQTMLK